jgi:outer membrane protein assembly factor BamB
MRRHSAFIILVLIIFIAAVLPGMAKKQDKDAMKDWPCQGGSVMRENNYDGSNPQYPLKKKWDHALGTDVDVCLAIRGSDLFAGIDQPKKNAVTLLRLDLAKGDFRWAFERRVSRLTLYPVVSGNLAFIGCKNLGMNRSLLYCVDLASGEKVWDYISQEDFSAQDRISTPCISGDRIYVPSTGRLLCLGTKDGKLLWQAPIAYPNAPLVQDGVVYTGNEAMNADTGALIWKYQDADTEADNPLTSPTLYQGKLFSGSARGDRIVAFDSSKGSKVWQYRLEHSWRMVPAAGQGMIIVTAEKDNKIVAFEPAAGEVLWEAAGRFSGNAAVTGEYLYAPSVDGHVIVLDCGNGEILFRTNPGMEKGERESEEGAESVTGEVPFHSTPVVAGRNVHIAGDRLFCLEQKGRKPRRTFTRTASSAQLKSGVISGTLYDRGGKTPLAGAAVDIFVPFALKEDGTVAPATLKAVTDGKGVFSTRSVIVEYTRSSGTGKRAKKTSTRIAKQVVTISLKTYKTFPVERQLREGVNNLGRIELEKEH